MDRALDLLHSATARHAGGGGALSPFRPASRRLREASSPQRVPLHLPLRVPGVNTMADSNRFDVIIIGTGAGGGTLAWALAPTGKRILLLERGDYVPREQDNWSPRAVNVEGRYQTNEMWRDGDGKPLHPHTNYWVGGNTKFYGAALFRL